MSRSRHDTFSLTFDANFEIIAVGFEEPLESIEVVHRNECGLLSPYFVLTRDDAIKFALALRITGEDLLTERLKLE